MRLTKKKKKIFTIIFTVLAIGIFIYFAVKSNNIKDINVKAKMFSGKAMGTVVKKTIYAEDEMTGQTVSKEIDEVLSEVEKQISVRVQDSDITKCNRNYVKDGITKLPDNLIGYLKREMEISKETNGALSPCIRPLADLWKIEDGEGRIPSERDIKDALPRISTVNFEVVEEGVIFHSDNMAIDFGATGKGIACDKVLEMLSEKNIQGAVVSIGGNVAVYGDKGNNNKWHIGVQDPRGEEGEYLGVVDLPGGMIVSTSGDYEKYFEEDGRRYHHIFDPATGYPAKKGLISVTIISDDGFLADALSTACFVMGLEEGMKYAEEKGVDAIFVTHDKKVYITKGIKGDFHIQADGYKLEK